MSDLLDLSQFEKFADDLANKYPAYAIDAAEIAITDMADFMLGKVPEYPTEILGRIAPPDGISWLRTPKQRAWFFAAVQADELPGWRWVDAKYGISYSTRKDPRNSGGYSFKDIRTEHRTLIEAAHPEKIGGARTGNLGRSQGRDIIREQYGVSAIMGFDSAIAPYAPWVVGPDYPGENIAGEMMYQARIHTVDNWWQFGAIMQENINDGWTVFNEVFWEEFSKRIEK